jgi:type III pantothenate kinase
LKVTYINQETKLPFTNLYQSETLGNDRKALVAGGIAMEKEGQDLLIIDAGTCVTYDFIDADKNYQGGAISPGLRLRYESLHNFTAKLPLLQTEPIKYLIGSSTDQSIHSGVINGLSFEIKGTIKKYTKKYPNLHVIITGGDSDLLVKQLKNRFFASPFLMLYGIHNLYKINT